MDIKLTLKSNNRTLEIGKDTYKLVNIDGIDSGNLELNTVSNAQFDGSVVVSKRIQNRPISITVDYKGTNSQEIERQNLISFFNPKNKGVLIVNYGGIERAIEYEIEDFNCKLANVFDTLSFTVDLMCPNPYWRNILESKINIAMWRGMFHFPLVMPSKIVPHSGADSTWKDLSGNLNNGLLSGFNSDSTSGWTAEGLKFDSDSYVALPSLDLQEGTIQVNNQVVTFDKDTDYRTTSANSNIVSLTSVDGMVDVEIGGNTRYKKTDGAYTDTWESGVTLRSVVETGENLELVSCGKNLFNGKLEQGSYDTATGVKVDNINMIRSVSSFKILPNTSITIKNYSSNCNIYILSYRKDGSFIKYEGTAITNITLPPSTEIDHIVFYMLITNGAKITDLIQLEEGTIATTYEPYKEDKLIFTAQEPPKGLPNGVRDLARGNVVNRKIKKIVLNGNENWNVLNNNNRLEYTFTLSDAKKDFFLAILSDKLHPYIELSSWLNAQIGITLYNGTLYIINNNITSLENLKIWLQANPTTVYYELATPTTENLSQNLRLKSFFNGTLQVNTVIAPYLSAYYPINLAGSVASNVSKIDLSNQLITTSLVKNYRVYNKILTTEEIARINTSDYLKGPSLLIDLNSSHKELSKIGIITGLREPSLIVNALNAGNVESGMIIEFKALGTLTNPSILNVETQEFFKVNKSMVAGEVITVNTNVGAKKVINNLNGVETNILNLIDLDSTFLQLTPGDNLLRYDADTNLNNLEINVYYNPYYLGV